MSIIILQDVANWLDGVQVLIPLVVEIVKWVSIWGVSIAESEVNGDGELDLASTKDIFEEGVSLVDDKILKAAARSLALTN